MIFPELNTNPGTLCGCKEAMASITLAGFTRLAVAKDREVVY